MKFQFIWHYGVEKTMFNILMGLKDKRHWLKGQRSTWTFVAFHSHYL